jgi:hypothetical protein
MLVIDRDATTRGDLRLLAHIAADEPTGNSKLLCERYLQDAHRDRYRCRRVTAEDLQTPPLAEAPDAGPPFDAHAPRPLVVQGSSRSYQLTLSLGTLSIPELRWRSCEQDGVVRIVSLREVVGELQSYEPACTLTSEALGVYGPQADVSTTVVGLELARVRESPIVLNRRLREVVLAHLEREPLSMSEIATRCGRVKRDRRGVESGETSWLSRRLGILPEGGQSKPTPWIHTDVLALIARRGLGISPREVEL